MNLIKIQEDLKGLPTQALMAYANGQNPEVPPFMAMTELSRRKKMEQSAQAPGQELQQGTVKDRLQQEVGLMHLQKQRQQQAMQAIGQRAQNAPAMNPDAAGIASVGSGPGMPQAAAFRGGGIVAMAEGGTVSFDGREYEIDPETGKVRYNGVPTDPSMLEYAERRRLRDSGQSRQEQIPTMRTESGQRVLDMIPGEITQPPATGIAATLPQGTSLPSAPAQAASTPVQKPPVAAPAGIAAIPGMGGAGIEVPKRPAAPQMGGLKEMYEEQQGILKPLTEAEDTARKERIALLQSQMDERKRNAADAQLAGFFRSMAGDGSGRSWDAFAAGARGMGDVQAEQLRLREEGDRELAGLRETYASKDADEARKALTEASKRRSEQYQADIHKYGYDSAFQGQVYKAQMDYKATMASIAGQLQAARESANKGLKMESVRAVNAAITAANDRLKSIDADLKNNMFDEAYKAELRTQKQDLFTEMKQLQARAVELGGGSPLPATGGGSASIMSAVDAEIARRRGAK